MLDVFLYSVILSQKKNTNKKLYILLKKIIDNNKLFIFFYLFGINKYRIIKKNIYLLKIKATEV